MGISTAVELLNDADSRTELEAKILGLAVKGSAEKIAEEVMMLAKK